VTKEEMVAKIAWAGVKQRLGGISGLADNPMVRLALRYWWIAAPAGLAAWSMYRNRKAKGEVTTAHLLADAGTILGPLVSLIMLAEFSRKEESKIVAGGQIKDAQFTPITPAGTPTP